MEPRARDFAAGPESGHGAAAGRINRDAAHMIVNRGTDWDQLRCGIDTGGLARSGNGGKARGEPGSRLTPGVEKHLMAFGQASPDAARHGIAWSKFGARLVSQKTPPGIVHQHGAFATNGLADKPRRATMSGKPSDETE